MRMKGYQRPNVVDIYPFIVGVISTSLFGTTVFFLYG